VLPSPAAWRKALSFSYGLPKLKDREHEWNFRPHKYLRPGILQNILIPLPPLAEQHRIVAKVDELMALCDQLEASLTTAQTEATRLLESVLHNALQDPGLA